MLYLNGQPLSVTHFPDNTSQVWKDAQVESLYQNPGQEAKVAWNFKSEAEFMELAQLKTLLDVLRIKAHLTLTYLPYGRQDKNISNTSTFGLRTFANLLNSLDFETVTIHDPHSEVALEKIHHSRAVYPVRQVEVACQTSFDNQCETILCYPDKGALSKYTKVYESLYRSHIYGEKVRDQLTGNITSYKVVGECAGKNVMIVDDICDGGATFKLLAKDLLAAGAKQVNLFVTHGIFSKGVRTLFEAGIKRVFTEDGEVSNRPNSFQV
jgi:ribose-phosphate pyrophosphokinase